MYCFHNNQPEAVLKVRIYVIANKVKQSMALIFNGLLQAIALAMTLILPF